MRVFVKFLLLVAVAAASAALLTYPAWIIVQSFADVPIHRVMHRVGMLVLGLCLFVLLRRWGLANRAALGYAKPRAEFIKQMLTAFVIGIALMMPLALALFGLSVRTFNDTLSALNVAMLIGLGLLTGWVVAFIEETLFRGALFGAIERESGRVWAVVLPTIIYAASHFIDGKLHIPNSEVTFVSGIQVVTNMFARFADPLELLDSFAALCALGTLLSLIRIRTNAIAGGIGLHAGGVAVIVVMRNISTVNPQTSMSWLVGSYDGVIGWLACAWIAVVAMGYWWMSRGRDLKMNTGPS